MDLRYAFFVRPIVVLDDEELDMNASLLGWGVFLSPNLSSSLQEAATSAFETIWMGCVH
jgi:hypothetical protein